MATESLDLLSKRKKCCDPFKLHEKPVTKGLRNISEKVRNIHRSLHFESDDQLCTFCRKQVAALPEELQTVASSQSEESGEEEEAKEAHAKPAIQESSAGTDAMFISPDHEISQLNASLFILGESPIMKRKLDTRALYVKEKTRKIQSTVMRKIELGIGHSVSDEESVESPCTRTARQLLFTIQVDQIYSSSADKIF